MAAAGDAESQVLACLRRLGDWASATAIHAATPELLNAEKVVVNRALYALRDKGEVLFTPGSPPSWKLASLSPDALPPRSAAHRTHCIIDLGNVHDCLQKLEPYAAAGALTVAAYADLAFSGYGIVPPLKCNNVAVFQADTPDRNSADVQIIWDVCRLVAASPGDPLHVLIATKDLGFMRLQRLVQERPHHKLTFVTGWEALKLHIE